MSAPDPFEMLRAYTAGTEMRQELDNARVEIARLRKELAEAQENYHQVNEQVARLLKERQANG